MTKTTCGALVMQAVLAGSLHAMSLDLGQCERLAAEHSPIVLAAWTRVEQASARLSVNYAAHGPQVDLVADWAMGAETQAVDDGSGRVSLAGTQEVLRYGRIEDARRSSARAARSAAAQYEVTLLEVISAVRKAYFTYLLTRDEIGRRQQLVEYFGAKSARLEERVQAGLATPVELSEAELEVLEQHLRISNLQRKLRSQRLALFSLMGVLGGEIELERAEILGPRFEEMDLLDPEETQLSELVEEAQRSRPTLLDLQSELAEQREEARGVRWQWAPDVGLGLSKMSGGTRLGLDWAGDGSRWKLTASGERALSLGKERLVPTSSLGGEGFTLEAGASLPLWRGGSRGWLSREQWARLDELRADRRRLANRIALEVVETFYRVKSLKQSIALLRKRADVTRKRLDMVEELFETARGNLNFDDVLRQRAAVNAAEEAFFEERLQYVLSTEELRRVLGRCAVRIGEAG